MDIFAVEQKETLRRVQLKVELEIESDERELEIELKW